MKSFFEENGGTYSIINGYRIPNLVLPEQEHYPIGIWGMRRHDYLKNHCPAFYTMLLMKCKLNEHLHEIDVSAHDRWELIIKQMMEAQGVTEQLKVEDMMKWVGMVNNIRACADEIIRDELIYN